MVDLFYVYTSRCAHRQRRVLELRIDARKSTTRCIGEPPEHAQYQVDRLAEKLDDKTEQIEQLLGEILEL